MHLIENALLDFDTEPVQISSSYVNRFGKTVPRVTEILSKTISEQGLMIWANNLGFKHIGYMKELNRTANIGTKAHNAIDRFLTTGEEANENVSFRAFMFWWKAINSNNKINIIGNEESLVCDYFGGTYDLLIEINGKVYLVDFKTSNHVTYRYFLQIAAYRKMIYEVKGINIDGAIILQLGKDDPIFKEYILDFSNVQHYVFIENCTNAFLALVYSYYNTEFIKAQYSEIFGRR